MRWTASFSEKLPHSMIRSNSSPAILKMIVDTACDAVSRFLLCQIGGYSQASLSPPYISNPSNQLVNLSRAFVIDLTNPPFIEFEAHFCNHATVYG
jgi:hypothetical protein